MHLEDEIYRSAPGINNSTLKLMRLSPAHYINAIENPKKEDTAAFQFGRMVHKVILEPHFNMPYVIRPDGMKFSTKEGREWKERQNLPIISMDEHEAIEAIKNNVLKHKVGSILADSDTKTEVSFFKRETSTGLLLKCRCDAVVMDDSWNVTKILDLKTTEEATASSFTRSCNNFGYARQAAFYGLVTGCWDFTFIAVEKTVAHQVQAFRISQSSTSAALRQIMSDLARIKECLETKVWPGYNEGITELEVLV